jgi:protein-L-isoaspartate(D-aspartate) O-methyltransferase
MGQTISQPYIVALMTDLLKLKGDERVLEVGTGSGYQAAVLARLAADVYTIERHASLSDAAKQTLAALEITNVYFHVGDGSLGLPEYAPYQGILITAAAPKAPASLLAQLAEGGQLVLPVGGKFNQMLEIWQRHGNSFEHTPVTAVAFVPLLGKEGWDEKKWDKFQLW